MRGSNTVNPRGSNTANIGGGGGSGGASRYRELPDRPNQLLEEEFTAGSTSTPVSVNNPQAVGVSIDTNAQTITSTVDGWGNSGVWDNTPRTGDFRISGSSTGSITGSRQIFGMSLLADAPSASPQKQRYAWFFKNDDSTAQVRELNSAGNDGTQVFDSGVYTASDVYSIVRTGSVITYLKNDTLVYTSLVASTGDLYFDVAFGKINGIFSNLRYGVDIQESLLFTLDLNNEAVKGFHIDELVSDTDFANVAAALADDAVKKATAGDFVRITGKIYHVIKTNPTLAAHLEVNAVNVEQATDAEVTAGTGTEPRIYTPKQIGDKVNESIGNIPEPSRAWKDINGMPPLFDITDRPVSTNPNFENIYKGGVSVTESSTGVTVKCTTAGWGNSGVWDNDNHMGANGSVSFIVDSTPNQTESMLGLSYRSSESDAISKAADLIDYAWYFLAPTRKAYIRETNSNGNTSAIISPNAELFDSSKVYGINRVGNKINYLIDGVIVHTSSKDSTGTLYLDLGFNLINSSFSQIRIQSDSNIIRNTELDYLNPKFINKPTTPTLPAQSTSTDITAGTITDTRLYSPFVVKTAIDTLIGNIYKQTTSDVNARTSTKFGLINIKQVADVASALISEIPAPTTGGGTASSVAWKDITGFPALFNITNDPVSVNPTFVNSVGVTIIYRDDGADVECTAGGWGSSGTWDEDNNIVADGAVSFIVTSIPSQSEQMLGLSYKNSEADATSITFNLIDYAWYFRASDSKAFVREASNGGTRNDNVTAYTGQTFDFSKVYSIQRVGTKINYLIDGVIVYTSAVDSTGTLHIDLALSRVNSAFSQIRIQRNLVNIHETKIKYTSPDLTDKLPESSSTDITAGTITDARVYSPSVIKAAIEALITAGGLAWKDITGLPSLINRFTIPAAIPLTTDNTDIDSIAITDNGNTITSTNGGAWDSADLKSTISMPSGNTGYVLFSTTATNTRYMVGLAIESAIPSGTEHFRTIDYAIYIDNASVKVYENNVLRTLSSAVAVAVGDVFKVASDGTTITYLKNDVVFYTSTVSVTTSLFVDIAFFTNGSIVKDLLFDRGLGITSDTNIDWLHPNLINKPNILQEARSSYEAENNMVMEGATAYEIAPLAVRIIPKSINSRIVISFDIKACAPWGHIFSFSVYVNGNKVNDGSSTLHTVDAVVPVPTTSGGESVINSVTGSVETIHASNLNAVTVKVFAWYHKDGVATDPTATLTLNRAKRNIEGLTYKLQGVSMMTVKEVEV